jgi:hypothetical protein
VSKIVPLVSIANVPFRGAFQLNQTECPPAFPAWFGSPGSFVAFEMSTAPVPSADRKGIGVAKESFAGAPDAAGTVHVT